MSYLITEQCVACRECIDNCIEKCIHEETVKNNRFNSAPTYRIDPEGCTDCGLCVDVCPVDAIEYTSG